MSNNIILKNNPRIEFKFLENGFQLIDGHTQNNSGFYAYHELQSVELQNAWFPRLAKSLRIFTWILNMGVPYFPDAESYKKSKLVFHFKKSKLGIWLTDSNMAGQAKILEETLDKKTI